ncbi:MAG: glycoside hydrolase family 16 protein [Lachnospiraceae bacterium]|nr:glycoside hydrolase family 16 protein [Lachnospiraceae bacterium]
MMGKNRTYIKRLLTFVLCAAMVFTSLNIPSVTVQAAQDIAISETISEETQQQTEAEESTQSQETTVEETVTQTETEEATQSTETEAESTEVATEVEEVTLPEETEVEETETTTEVEETLTEVEETTTEVIETEVETEVIEIEETLTEEETEEAEFGISGEVVALDTAETEVIISEQQNQAFVGNAVTLTYVANTEDFAFGTDYTVKVNGTDAKDKVTVNDSTITLDSSLFTSEGVYTILFEKAGCVISPVYQKVYANGSTDEWNLVWYDEFAGNALDTSKWDYQTGNGSAYGISGWGNEEEQYYTDSTENTSVGDGTLTITAKKDGKYEGSNYTSARLRTVVEELDANGNAKTGTPLKIGTYGKIEAKMKLPAGKGVWPAFWMLPHDSEYGSWATSGEIDIMEARGRLTNTVCGTIHYGGVWPNNVHNGKDYYFAEGDSFEEYHIYTVEWDPTEIRWYVDGEEYSAISNWYAEAGEEGNYPFPAPFDEDFYILLNLAVGGTFDSVASEDVEVDENGVSMDVDYVRWYQRDQEVYDNWEITGPTIEKDETETADELLAKTDENGNFIKDGNFTEMNTTPYTADGSWEIKDGYWAALLIPGNGAGEAAWSKVDNNGKNYLKVEVTEAGSQTYSSQMLQYLPMVKGYSYEISYSAYTDTLATKADVSLKIGGDNDNGWAVYSGNYTDELTTTPTTYTHKFTMTGETDATARFEFNLATSEGNVYLSDVSVKLTEINENDGEDDAKKPLSDGNHVYNGEFNIGMDSLLYWHWTGNDDVAKVAVGKEDGNRVAQVKATAESPVSVWQLGMNLLQKDAYELTFDVNSEAAQNIGVAFTSADGQTTYYTENKAVQAGKSTVTIKFTQPEGKTDEAAKMMFTFAGNASLDNVKLIRKTNSNVDFSSMEIWPIYNGDFFNGKDGWNIWSQDGCGIGSEVNADGQLETKVTIVGGAAFYSAGIQSAGMKLNKGINYRVKFDYDIPSEKTYKIELAGVQRDITLPAGKGTYVSEPFTGAGNTMFTLYLGPVQAAEYTILLDNVEVYIDPDSLTVPEGYAKPVSLAQDGEGNTVDGAVVKYSENTAWEAAANKEYYINGTKVSDTNVVVDKENNLIKLDVSCFAKAGSYTFAVAADGFTTTKAITLTVMDAADTNKLLNGNFSDGTNSWGFWTDPSCSTNAFTVEDGVAKVYHHYNIGNAWDLQLFQEGLAYEAGDYVLSFDAWADVERPINLRLQNGNDAVAGTDNYVLLSTTKPQKSYTFLLRNLNANQNVKLNFQMGSMTFNGVPALNDGANPYNIYFDNIILRPAEESDYDTMPGVIATPGSATIGEDVEVTYTEAFSKWKNAEKTVYVNGKAVANDKVTATDNGLTIDKSVFTATGIGRYEIYIIAEGFDKTNSVYKNVIDLDGNHIFDGDLSKQGAWEIIDENKEGLSAGVIENGEYKLDYNAGYYRDDWKCWVDWSSQLKQSNISLDAGTSYVLRFDAETNLAGGRDINIEMSGQGKTAVSLTEERGTYEVQFDNAQAIDNFYITFLVGPVGEKLQQNDGNNACVVPHTLTIDNISLTVAGEEKEGLRVSPIPNQTYTGKAIKPELTVFDGYKRLSAGKDYTVTFKNNKNKGTAKVTVKGKGNYAGTATTEFEIVQKNVADEDIVLIYKDKLVETTKNQKPLSKVTYNGKSLTGKEYKVEYFQLADGEVPEDAKALSQVKKAGTYQMVITGKGNFTGSRSETITVYPKNSVKDMSKLKVKFKKVDSKGNVSWANSYSVVWDGTFQTPEIAVFDGNKMVEAANYIVEYDPVSCNKVGTASIKVTGVMTETEDGISGYIGSTTKTFKINATKLSNVAEIDATKWKKTVSIDEVTGFAVQESNMLKLKAGKVDENFGEGSAYTVSYTKNNKAGTATVIYKGIGKYNGTIKKTFSVAAISLFEKNKSGAYVPVEGVEVNVEESVQFVQKGSKAAVTVIYKGIILEEGKDYKLTYKNNKAVTTAKTKENKKPQVTITGINGYKGKMTVKFVIEPTDLSTLSIVSKDVAYQNKKGKFMSAPVVTDLYGSKLKAGRDYTVKYYLGTEENAPEVTKQDVVDANEIIKVVVTAKENGNYIGSIETSYVVVIQDISKAKVTVKSKPYTGKAITLTPEDFTTIKVGDTKLVEGKHYVIVEDSYVNNINKGKASVIIRGVNNYGGEKKVTFTITSRPMSWVQNLFKW